MMSRALLIGCCAVSPSLAAQSISLQGRVAFPLSSSQVGVAFDSTGRHRLIDRGGGVWGGLALEARVVGFSASVTGLRGGLGDSNGMFPARDGGEVSALVRYEVHPGIALETRHTTRVFVSAAGRQQWVAWGIGVLGSRKLGSEFVHASGAIEYLPVVRITGGVKPSFGIAADLALTVMPRRTPVVLSAGYRIEKFSFPDITYRAEQFEVLTLSLGVRMQRQDGRWTLTNRGGQ